MKISKRLLKIAELVSSGASAADIGTDHGYVPLLLMKGGKCPRVIMSDISVGSLSKAKETFEDAGLMGMVDTGDFRIGDGLQPIEPGEADELIIAGLGGHTIAAILSADEEKTRSFKRLILQPRKHSGTLRFWLYTHGWVIESENLAPEGKFACEIITAVPAGDPEGCGSAAPTSNFAACGSTNGRISSQNSLPARRPTSNFAACGHITAPYPEDDIRWKYPKAMAEADRDLAMMRIDWKISSIEEQLRSLESAEGDHSQLICRLKSDLSYLRDL